MSYLPLCFAVILTSSHFVIRYSTATYAYYRTCPSDCTCSDYRPDGDENYGVEFIDKIDCQKLELTTVPDLSMLSNSYNPKYVILKENEIKKIIGPDFSTRANIVILDLSVNKGIQLYNDAFTFLKYSLKKLIIDAVDIAFDRTLDIFEKIIHLNYLSLAHNNKLGYTKGAVRDVKTKLIPHRISKSLKTLDLSDCRIQSMSENTLEGLVNLENLILANNWLTSIPSTINHLSNLKFLDLYYGKIKYLEDNDFLGSPKLEKIDLSSNYKLAKISDKAFSGCENSLKNLNLQRCNLTEIPTRALRNLKRLEKLDISENKFSNVGKDPFVGEYKLRELIISSKALKLDSNTFKGQEGNIRELSIPRMDLKAVPLKSLKTLNKLQSLSLEFNQISSLPKNAFKGLSVTSFRLNSNPLSTIEKGAFDGLQPMIAINLKRTKMADIAFLTDYDVGAIVYVNLWETDLVCRCSMRKDATKVLKTIEHISGSCRIDNKIETISSSRLMGVIEKACRLEG